jgi:hypothetical protein
MELAPNLQLRRVSMRKMKKDLGFSATREREFSSAELGRMR